MAVKSNTIEPQAKHYLSDQAVNDVFSWCSRLGAADESGETPISRMTTEQRSKLAAQIDDFRDRLSQDGQVSKNTGKLKPLHPEHTRIMSFVQNRGGKLAKMYTALNVTRKLISDTDPSIAPRVKAEDESRSLVADLFTV